MKTNHKVVIALIAGTAIGGAAVQGLHAQAKPHAYVITEVEVINQEVFKDFAPKVQEVVKASGGSYLARGGQLAGLEGQPPKRMTCQP